MFTSRLSFALTLAALLAASWNDRSLAKSIYVNSSTGDDSWTGLCAVWDGATCGPKRTIQAALGVSLIGDDVFLADGTYGVPSNSFLYLYGRSLRGSGSERCTIDFGGTTTYIFIFGDVPCVISGLAVVNARDTALELGSNVTASNLHVANCGYGVYISNGATLSDSLIEHNTVGIYGYGGNATRCSMNSNVTGALEDDVYTFYLSNCTLSGNQTGVSGGVTLASCTISGSQTGVSGGANLTGCTIAGNQTGVSGSAYLSGCTISGNQGSGVSGNASLADCTISGNGSCGVQGAGNLVRCVISGNVNSQNGGGVSGPAHLEDCIVTDNITGSSGGGAFGASAVNCTFSRNIAVFFGGGIASSAATSISNCIFWGDLAGFGNEFASLGVTAHGFQIGYCDVQGGLAGVYADNALGVAWGLGNIAADPKFSDFAQFDFHLFGGSPCIDAGLNIGVVSSTDLEGKARFVDDPATPDTGLGTPPMVDIGAYEFAPPPPILCPTDLNHDGVTDLGDLAQLLAHFGETNAPPGDGDTNGDNKIDLSDLAALLALFGAHCP